MATATAVSNRALRHARSVVGQEQAWRAHPSTFSRRVAGMVWPPHLRLIGDVLVLVATRRLPRLTVSLPPGHAKTLAISRTYPAWMLELWPERKLIQASYGSALAVENGKAVREMIEENTDLLRVRLKGDSRAADAWQTTKSGGMWTTGAGGTISGRRATDVVVDDPHKNFDEAHSATARESLQSWWTSVMRTRMLPGASAMVVSTRWHEDDLVGWITTNDEDGRYAHLRLPAIAEEDETIETVLGVAVVERLRKMGAPVPTWHRKAGEALWPTTVDPASGIVMAWFDLEFLEEIHAEMGEYQWNALYQQRPSPPGGEMFPASMWDRADALPPKIPLVRYWDLAATAGGGDQTVGALVGRDTDGFTYIADIVHGRWSGSDVKKVLRSTAQADVDTYGKHRMKVIFEKEGGSGGKSWAEELLRGPLAGFNAEAWGSSGDKTTRALGLASQQQAGFVRLVRRPMADGTFGPAPWFDHLIEEARAFPHGSHDDMVDACCLAFNSLLGRARKPARTRTAASRSVG